VTSSATGAPASGPKVQTVITREKPFGRGHRYAAELGPDMPFRDVYVLQAAIDALGGPMKIRVTLEPAD
jgi:hypothetical protein